MKPNPAKTAAEVDVALATIAGVATAAMVVAGPSRAGNNQHSTQCFGLRDDPIHPGEPRSLSISITQIRKSDRTANEINRRWGRRNGDAETAHQLGEGQLGHRDFSDLRPSWLHRRALLLELAGSNHGSRALLGWR